MQNIFTFYIRESYFSNLFKIEAHYLQYFNYQSNIDENITSRIKVIF